MPAPGPFASFLEPFERLGVPYCIIGSVAASVYGEPRLTADIDVVLQAATEIDRSFVEAEVARLGLQAQW